MSNKNIILTGVLAVCLSATLWGFDGIVLTPRLYNLPVPLVVFLLHAIPFTLMNFFFFKEYRLLKKMTLRDFVFLTLIALLGGALGTLAIVKALFLVNFQSLTIVVLLQKLQPVFAITLAAVVLKEKLHGNFILWAVVAILAGYFLTFGFSAPDFSTGSNTGKAALLSVVAAFCFGASTVFSRGLVLDIPFHSATFFRYGLTSVILLVILLGTGADAAISDVTAFNWQIIAIIIFTTGPGAIFLYLYGLKKIPATIASICELCFPLSAIIFDFIFNGKVLSLVQWIGAAVMIFAIIKLSSISQKE
jgi:drug/metabolite transporter (DMT)-like permease